MPIKVNGVEGSLSRFALKILFLRSDSGVKKEDFSEATRKGLTFTNN